MAEVEREILDEKTEIIWVLEQDALFRPGTAEGCRDFMDDQGSSLGWCVGDSRTQPTPGTFDTSPFSIGRGFDIIVPRDTMTIEFTTNSGTPSGNENLTGAEVLLKLREILAD